MLQSYIPRVKPRGIILTEAALNTPPYSLAMFPFLKTSAPVSIGNITFRSTDDTSQLSAEQAERVREIAEMLFLKNDLRIKTATYAVVPFIDVDHPGPDLEYLSRVQAVVAYEYASPHEIFGDPFLSTEHASLAIFSPGRVSLSLVRPEHHVQAIGSGSFVPDGRHWVEGYTGLYNFRHHFWVAKGSRLYGPMPHLTLNISQDLSELEHLADYHPDLKLLFAALSGPETATTKRILTAIRWYNAANAEANDETKAMVDLAIAFETMFGFPDNEKRTERLTDAISLLLGRIPRLEEWALQFYQTRSKIVHEGHAQQLNFVVRDTGKAKDGTVHQSLLAYGRQVFRLCVETLLTGAHIAERAGLHDKLVTNQERFQAMCKILAEESVEPIEKLTRVAALVRAVDRYMFVSGANLKMETLLGAVRLAATALMDCEHLMDPQLQPHLQRLSRARRTSDHYEELEALQAVHVEISSANNVAHSDEIRETVFRLIDTVWAYVSLHFYWLKQQREVERGT